jgi:hypothetical protein
MDSQVAARRPSQVLRRTLIAVEGLITVYATIFLWPVGGVLILANAVGAIVSRGVNRWMCAGIAVVGAILFLLILFFGIYASGDTVMTRVVPSPE